MKNKYGKLIWAILVRLSWVYFVVTDLIYVYCILDDGLFDTVKYTRLDEVGTALMAFASIILVINYPVFITIARIKIHLFELRHMYDTPKPSKKKRKNSVPIITVK